MPFKYQEGKYQVKGKVIRLECNLNVSYYFVDFTVFPSSVP